MALGAILLLVLGLLGAYELDAGVDLVRLEFVEVEAAADGSSIGFVGEENQLGKGSANLYCGGCVRMHAHGGGRKGCAGLTSTATWLTMAVWFGRRMSRGSCS